MYHSHSLALLVFTGSVLATPHGVEHLNLASRQTTSSPCALVSSNAAAALKVSPDSTPIISAQLAYDCLNSVELHTEEALDLVNAILPFLQWQSDLAYLANPPAGYWQPAVDVLGGFNEILANISGGVYTTEYDFQSHLWSLVNSVHDNHFRFLPDLISKALTFQRPVTLVSVSRDGTEEPKVYAYNDILASSNSLILPSALTTINGEDVYTFLEAESNQFSLHDQDALYNAVMWTPAMDATYQGSWTGYFGGSEGAKYKYRGPNTTIGYENGTIITYENTASVIGNFKHVKDGESFFQQFCTGLEYPDDPYPTGIPVGYPTPDIISPDQAVAGYFLDDYPEVAVLSILSFEADVSRNFQKTVQGFLKDAKDAGKTKLVIDLAANFGGYILLAYDTFRQLFPQIKEDGLTRFRDHEGLNLIAEQYAVTFSGRFNLATASDDDLTVYTLPPNYRFDKNLSYEHFPNVQAKFGPHEFYGDNFSSIIRWDLDDPLATTDEDYGLGIEVTGYGSRKNFVQPFAPEDIIMIYDGICSSSCTIFSELMRVQAGVKSIALGGRRAPAGSPTPIMQALGGTKGSNNYDYDLVNTLAEYAYKHGTRAQKAQKNWTESLFPLMNDLPVRRSRDTSLNVRDNILRSELDSGMPTQFIYEPADCRLFYTPEMIANVTAIWSASAEAAWGSKACVAGSLSDVPSSASGRKLKRGAVEMQERDMRVVSSDAKPANKTSWFLGKMGQRIPLSL